MIYILIVHGLRSMLIRYGAECCGKHHEVGKAHGTINP